MNVKRAVAAAAGVIGTLLLVAAVGAGYLAGHSTSGAGAGASSIAHATARVHNAAVPSTGAAGSARTAAPVKATLDAQIYGDSIGVSIYGDGVGLSGGTTTGSGGSGSGGSGTGDGATVGATGSGGGGAGTVTADIYGD